MMKAKELFEIMYNIEDLSRDEMISIIWSNSVDDDFIGVMCALMDFVELPQQHKIINKNKTRNNKT